MKSAYPKIFEPITIKRTTIKNRIAMTPMGTNYGETSGEMSNRHMNYYSLRAKGGVGLIILDSSIMSACCFMYSVNRSTAGSR